MRVDAHYFLSLEDKNYVFILSFHRYDSIVASYN